MFWSDEGEIPAAPGKNEYGNVQFSTIIFIEHCLVPGGYAVVGVDEDGAGVAIEEEE